RPWTRLRCSACSARAMWTPPGRPGRPHRRPRLHRPERLTVDAEHPDAGVLSRAEAALQRGELLIYPTDTLYALGGRALEADAARRVGRARGREADNPLPLVLAGLEQLGLVCAGWPPAADRLAEVFWPGPLTLVVPARPELPGELTAGAGSIAVRVPAAPL